MIKQAGIFQSDRYRAWIDHDNIGRIKILRRVNFVTIITVIRQISEAQERNSGYSREIRIYIPTSLRAICSENLKSFIEFTRICCNTTIIVIESDDDGEHII